MHSFPDGFSVYPSPHPHIFLALLLGVHLAEPGDIDFLVRVLLPEPVVRVRRPEPVDLDRVVLPDPLVFALPLALDLDLEDDFMVSLIIVTSPVCHIEIQS